jgi:hypothetical protein
MSTYIDADAFVRWEKGEFDLIAWLETGYVSFSANLSEIGVIHTVKCVKRPKSPFLMRLAAAWSWEWRW